MSGSECDTDKKRARQEDLSEASEETDTKKKKQERAEEESVKPFLQAEVAQQPLGYLDHACAQNESLHEEGLAEATEEEPAPLESADDTFCGVPILEIGAPAGSTCSGCQALEAKVGNIILNWAICKLNSQQPTDPLLGD